jgi:hypothetical protein
MQILRSSEEDNAWEELEVVGLPQNPAGRLPKYRRAPIQA